jgi:di/tricarboxylate transporter
VTFAQLIVIAVILIPLVLIASNRLRLDMAAIMTAIALAVAQLLGFGVLGGPNTPDDAIKALSGLAQPVTVTLFSLFIITRCLDKTGITRWLAQRILKVSGQSEMRLVGLLTLTTAFFSLFMNNLAAGALVLPTAMEVSRRTSIKPSKLLIPVAYGSCLGGAATYFTTANIIASDLLRAAHPPQAPLHILDFTPTGGLIAIAGILFVSLFGRRLLPDRASSAEQLIARRTGSELEDVYQLGERLWEARVLPDSPLSNKSLSDTYIGQHLGLSVVALQHGRQSIFAPAPEQVIHPGDILLIVGREERVTQLVNQGLRVEREATNTHISTRGIRFVEVLPAPHSSSEGRTLRELEFRRKYGFTAVALLRNGRSYRTDVAEFKLQLGDSLLMVGESSQLKALQNIPDFIVLEPDLSDQPVHWRQAAFAVTVTLAAIVASIFGFPVYMATLIAATLMLVVGLLTMEEAYRTMEWQAIILIAGMYPISLAMANTGLAGSFGQAVVSLVAPFGSLGLVAGSYLLTALVSQVVAGQVTTLITGPIVISAAISTGTSPQAVAVASAIACSASFLTPLAHPVNMLMIGPANYKFGDFFRAGWILTVICFIMLLIGMKLFWNV